MQNLEGGIIRNCFPHVYPNDARVAHICLRLIHICRRCVKASQMLTLHKKRAERRSPAGNLSVSTIHLCQTALGTTLYVTARHRPHYVCCNPHPFYENHLIKHRNYVWLRLDTFVATFGCNCMKTRFYVRYGTP